MNQNGGETIINKINGALATFRRERDDNHRAKELAVERLRLVRVDRESTEKNIAAMKEKLRQLKDGTVASRGELVRVENEVEQLRREVSVDSTF